MSTGQGSGTLRAFPGLLLLQNTGTTQVRKTLASSSGGIIPRKMSPGQNRSAKASQQGHWQRLRWASLTALHEGLANRWPGHLTINHPWAVRWALPGQQRPNCCSLLRGGSCHPACPNPAQPAWLPESVPCLPASRSNQIFTGTSLVHQAQRFFFHQAHRTPATSGSSPALTW